MSGIAILVSSHGFFAQEAIKSVEMIMGTTLNNVKVLSVVEGKDYDACLNEGKELVNSLDTSKGLLILTDIYGGTPSNVATYLAIENPNILVYSGFNLPILLELMYMRNNSIEDIKTNIEETYKNGLTCISDKLKEKEIEHGNQMDSY